MSWKGIITNAGSALLSKRGETDTLTISRAAAGAGRVSEMLLMAQTALQDEKQTMSIASKKLTKEGVVIKTHLTAPDTGYLMGQYGLWARLNSGEETLMAIFQNEADVNIPSKSDSPDFMATFNSLLTFANSGSIEVIVDPSALVSRAEMEEYVASATADYAAKSYVDEALKKKADLDESGKVPANQLPAMDYVPTTRKVNEKALSADITLTASDVGAPTKAGVGATGEWPIDINGNAESANSVVGQNATLSVFQNADDPCVSVKNTATGQIMDICAPFGVPTFHNYGAEIKDTLYPVPRNDGANANGTWPISITGNAATADNATQHIINISNPHSVNWTQTGAAPLVHTHTADQIAGRLMIETGSYIGTGTFGEASPNTLTFGFVPKVVFIIGDLTGDTDMEGPKGGLPWIYGQSLAVGYQGSGFSYDLKLSWLGTTLQWCWVTTRPTVQDGIYQLNEQGRNYRYLAIG